ncbi:MAG: hypothetical protein A2W31_01760 [Planctomycetes bacterium RBG_16_64_10]|nr:MAG: hypothetical protein A2W31_01760 [Planctomycetes bacterium RBG_16_64_10]
MFQTPRSTYPWNEEPRTGWKRYLYAVLAAEISTSTRFFDECVQLSPLPHDGGLLFEALQCPAKRVAASVGQVPDARRTPDRRVALLLNGNFNYLTDVQQDLSNLRPKLSRHTRLFVLMYNPFMSFLYTLASWLGLRHAPRPDVFLSEANLRTVAQLAGFQIVRIRPSVYLPIRVPLVSNLVNRILPIVPLVRRMSLAWVVVLRPIVAEARRPSLSIVVPARNEAGNIDNVVRQIPRLEGTDMELIFVGGKSTDATWQRIQDVVTQPNEGLRTAAFRQPGTGKNDAVRVGFERATGDLVVILDADLSVLPKMLPRFYQAYCQGMADLINGNRLVYPMEAGAMRPLNRIGNILFARTLAWILGLNIGDSLCGTKLLNRQDYHRMVAWRNRFGDFDPFGDFELLFAASELALGVIDVPIRYAARTYGETNIRRFHHGFQLARMMAIGLVRVFLGKVR